MEQKVLLPKNKINILHIAVIVNVQFEKTVAAGTIQVHVKEMIRLFEQLEQPWLEDSCWIAEEQRILVALSSSWKINLQSLKDTQVGYISKNTLQRTESMSIVKS